MTEAGTNIGPGGSAPLPRSPQPERQAYRGPEARLERLHAYFLEGCTDEIRPVLESVLADARRVHAGYADDEVGDGLASVWYAATAIVELGAALELDEADVRGAGAAIAEACALPLSAARYVLFREVVRHPRLLELPPLMAIELQLGLLLGLDVLSDVTLWVRTPGGLDCIVTLGGDGRPSRRTRAEAKATLRQRSRLSLLGGSQLRSATVLRFGEAYAAIVGRVGSVEQSIADAYLQESAASLSHVIEREHLLDYSASRERTLIASAERRLMRLGFDLHDGPIQDVLALAARRPAPAAAGLPVHPRGLSRADTRPLRRPLVAARRARSPAARDRALARDEERHLAAARRDPASRGRQLLRADGNHRRARDPRRSRLALLRAAHHRVPRDPGGARERARARERDDRLGPRARAPKRDRAPDRRRRDGVRGRARAREGGAARPPRSRRHRRARAHGRRHLRAREPARRPHLAQAHAPALGAPQPG